MKRFKIIYLIGLLVSSQMGILRLGTCLLQGKAGPWRDCLCESTVVCETFQKCFEKYNTPLLAAQILALLLSMSS